MLNIAQENSINVYNEITCLLQQAVARMPLPFSVSDLNINYLEFLLENLLKWTILNLIKQVLKFDKIRFLF